MTAHDALGEANHAAPGERARRYESRCVRRGGCRQEPFQNDPGRWTWCPDCLTVFDDFGTPVNPILD